VLVNYEINEINALKVLKKTLDAFIIFFDRILQQIEFFQLVINLRHKFTLSLI
jgi:hypothetical protein